MIRKFFSWLFGRKAQRQLPMAVTNARQMEAWRISYTRDGRCVLQGWVGGAYLASNIIKAIEGKIVVDVMGNRYSLGEPDGGEWAYSLRLRWPQNWEWFNSAGILPTA